VTQDTFFPYHSIGLRANPFRALTREEWEDIAFIPPALKQAYQSGECVQIMGEKGMGKTSCLLALKQDAIQGGRQVAYEYLPEGQQRFSLTLDTLDVGLLDEAQRLTRREIRRLLRMVQHEDAQVILGTHTDLKSAFQQRKLPLHTHTLEVDREGTRRMIDCRLGYFALDRCPPHQVAGDAITYLVDDFPTYRAMAGFLYDVFLGLPAPGMIDRVALETVKPNLSVPPA